MVGGLGPGTVSNRDKLALIGFLLFAVLIGVAIGYMAYWARQEALATFTEETRDESGPVVSVHPVGSEGEAIHDFDGDSASGRDDDTGGRTMTEPESATPGYEADRPVRPRIAIVIDDWGYDWAAADSFFEFPEKLTVAVLPFLSKSVVHAERALEVGHEVIVHMPMEAQNSSIDIGPGGVFVSMHEDDIVEAVSAALAAVPGASGLNNHMGSRATTEPGVMRAVLRVLQEHDKFFVDSFTTAATVGPTVAREMALPYAVNHVFLDHEDDEEHIRGQIERLAQLARARGEAIGIGHVRSRTYAALMDMLPELQAEGFEFVTVSELLNVPEPVDGAQTEVTATITASEADVATAASEVDGTVDSAANDGRASGSGVDPADAGDPFY